MDRSPLHDVSRSRKSRSCFGITRDTDPTYELRKRKDINSLGVWCVTRSIGIAPGKSRSTLSLAAPGRWEIWEVPCFQLHACMIAVIPELKLKRSKKLLRDNHRGIRSPRNILAPAPFPCLPLSAMEMLHWPVCAIRLCHVSSFCHVRVFLVTLSPTRGWVLDAPCTTNEYGLDNERPEGFTAVWDILPSRPLEFCTFRRTCTFG